METEELLPEKVKGKAIRSGSEWGWRKEDLPEVYEAARELGLATLGGQVQFVFDDGTCELYWLNIDPNDRKESEDWAQFVNRSIAESLAQFHRLCQCTDFIEEGTKSFDFIKRKLKNQKWIYLGI